MQNQNNEAQKKAKSKASERKAKLVLDKQKRQDLKTNKLNAGRDLKVLEKSHEDAFKIYCVHQTFWQQLITLHRVIKFDFEQYDKFNELFSSYSVEKQKCEKLVEPLACKEFEEPEAENFHNTCGNANGEKCNTFANGASLESGHFINNIYDIDNYIVTYDTNKRMSAARESLSYQFFSLTAKSINFFKQTAYIAAQQASSSFSTAADSVNGVSEYFTNMHNTEIYNQPENQIQVINPNSFNISDIFVVSRCQQSNLSESRLVSGCIVNESDSFTKFIAQNEYISHEREQSDTTYTPSPLNFAGDIDSNLMLSSIWIHVLKESYSWATRMFSSENIVEEKEQAEASHGYITEIFCESKKELQNINRLIRSLTINRRDPEDYSWAQDALEYRREELRDLQRKPKIFLSDLEEMKLDILHLKNEIQNELTPIETILGGNTSKNLSKFGIFSANTTTHLNINMKALINQRTEIPILPSNAANNYFGR